MGRFVWLVVVVTVMCSDLSDSHHNNNREVYDILYYDAPPFIYENEIGETDGILVKIFNKMQHVCGTRRVKYIRITGGYKNFLKIFGNQSSVADRQSVNNTDIIETDVDKKYQYKGNIIMPYLSKTPDLTDGRWNMTPWKVGEFEEAHVIKRRYQVELFAKVWLGVKNCWTTICVCMCLALTIGMLVVLIETKLYTTEELRSHFHSTLNGFWWAMVTMTTVGYGDKVPHTIFGRLVGIIWMVASVIFVSVITATVTASVTGTNDYQIHHQKIGVLKDSREYHILNQSKELQVKLFQYETFEDVLEAVQNDDVYAGIMNGQTSNFYQEKYCSEKRPKECLVSIYSIKMYLPVGYWIPQNRSMHYIREEEWECFKTNQESVEKSVFQQEQWISEHIPLYQEENFMENPLLMSAVFIALITLIISIVFELYRKVWMRGTLEMHEHKHSQDTCSAAEMKIMIRNQIEIKKRFDRMEAYIMSGGTSTGLTWDVPAAERNHKISMMSMDNEMYAASPKSKRKNMDRE